MKVSDEVRAAQIAYAARPFEVYWVDSHASIANRFHTFDDAFAYVMEQWARINKYVRDHKYSASNLSRSYIETPDGQKMPLRFWLLTKDVSSY